MGAWSSQPFGNDTAGDWFDTTMAKMKIVKHIDKGLKSKNHDIARAAAFLLERVGFGYIYPSEDRERQLEMAIDRMQVVLDDHEWINAWRTSREVKQSIRKQIKNLQNQLARKYEELLLDKIGGR